MHNLPTIIINFFQSQKVSPYKEYVIISEALIPPSVVLCQSFWIPGPDLRYFRNNGFKK